MSRLRLQAAGSSSAAEDGNAEPLNFTVSITDHGGDAVKHLKRKAFDLNAFVVGPGGTPFDLGLTTEAIPGVYVFSAIPTRPWNDGEYLFVLTVEHDGDRGQTIIPVTVPEQANV
jgi:hypothetical protein